MQFSHQHSSDVHFIVSRERSSPSTCTMNLVLPLLPNGQQLLSVAFGIFKCFGFIPFPFDCCTFALTPCSNVRSLLHLPILQVSFYLTLFCIIMSNRVNFFFTGLQILSLNDIIKYGTLTLSVFAIFIDTVLQRNTHRLVWEKIALIRLSARKVYVERFTRHYLWKFYGYLAVCAFLEAQVLYLAWDDPSALAYWLVIMILHAFLRLRHLFHMFFIDILKIHLQKLHHDLVDAGEYMADLVEQPQDTAVFRAMYAQSVDRLLSLKSVYGQLWELSDCINRNFGWSQICNFTGNFVQLSCDLYWLYMSMKWFEATEYKVVIVITLLPSTSIIVLLLSSAESCLGVAASLQSALLDIPMGNDSTFRKIIYRFGLQIAQQRIRLTAHGLFEINYSLLKMFGTGITTYMIIFITFSKDIKLEDIDDE
ncbi:AGAP009857-PA [Anopheles gambiae str. PEST]|uniref:Gustatory receptor n=1 Tax=Anopheles gambiae TaxID=7165 RepID=Q7PK13_ANOGA|nr:AGAP009857-PA [Anopheles gambiae str. PEST]